MKTAIFQGAATAIVSPFAQGELDIPAFCKILDYQAEGGISAIVVCGTTGEGATLTEEEKLRLYDVCIQRSAGRMKVICGVGSNNTSQALKLAKKAELLGADGVMVVTPYYNKTSQEGLVQHFFHVADGIGIPVIVYNVPSRTGIGIQPDTYVKLAEHPNINGAKEASGNVGEFAHVQAMCGKKLNFWSGNDSDTLAMMALGAQGVISVASNILPDAVSQICHLCLEGDFSAAAKINRKYIDIFNALFIDVNPIPIKEALNYLGFCKNELRLPLVNMNKQKKQLLCDSIDILQIP